jgi:predicted DNA binding CopG/RHH family protein
METKMAKLVTEMTRAELDDITAKQLLDEEEQDIEEALRTTKDLKGMGRTAANAEWRQVLANTERKSPVTLRVSEDVMRRIRMKARVAGLPYQTLINSLLHRYAHGQIKGFD